MVTQALEDAKVTLADVDAIGVTYGPGLVGALLVGVAEGKSHCFCGEKAAWWAYIILRAMCLRTFLKIRIWSRPLCA